MEAKLRSHLRTVLRYEELSVRAKALSVIPLERLRAEAREGLELAKEIGGTQILGYDDYFVESLAHWFKGDFFVWVTSLPCWNCGRSDTRCVQVTTPTPEEAKHGAGRVEIFQCPQCGTTMRFPRYNCPSRLMDTRKGRCGEWANAFSCLCRALDIEARFVVDWTDHVWTEFYSRERQRWVHVDCCECILDKPLLYEGGWGKRLSYVVAFDRCGVTDVTRRYVLDWAGTRSRRKEIAEASLEEILSELTAELRTKLSLEEIQQLEERDAAELWELMEGPSAESLEALPGRTTGSAEWREGRGETGTAASPRKPRVAGTRFRRVALAVGEGSPVQAALRASGENAPGETAAKLLDSNPETKWLDFGGGGENGSAWVECSILNSSQVVPVIGRYALTSANDCEELDPSEWELQGLPEGDGSEWQVLDRQSNVIFDQRHQKKVFKIKESRPCRRIRLCFWKTRQPRAASALQVSLLEFFPGKESEALQPDKVVDLPLEGKMQQLYDLFSKSPN